MNTRLNTWNNTSISLLRGQPFCAIITMDVQVQALIDSGPP